MYEDMTIDELLAEQQHNMAKRAELKAEAVEIQMWIDRRTIQARVDSLTDAEREHLRQILGAQGIKSEEVVGRPGT
jgi:hypothetical protein